MKAQIYYVFQGLVHFISVIKFLVIKLFILFLHYPFNVLRICSGSSSFISDIYNLYHFFFSLLGWKFMNFVIFPRKHLLISLIFSLGFLLSNLLISALITIIFFTSTYFEFNFKVAGDFSAIFLLLMSSLTSSAF